MHFPIVDHDAGCYTAARTPEAVKDIAGMDHLFELKTSGKYSMSLRDNIFPAASYAERRGIPFTLELQGKAGISGPLRRFIEDAQRRFGGTIIEP